MSTYFKDQGKRGENAELQEELTSNDKSIKRDAVKKVIRDMTLGKDVSSLFSAVVNNMMTPNLEVRKLVYLYLINYAKTQPELTIMAVNGFVKDASDPNPLIRALAVRTMGCIRVKSISEYLCESLRRALKDSDPYVRKTAAICVVKLHEISPELVEDQGFIDTLESLLSDGNPMVVSNSVAALAEMSNRIHNKTLLQQERFATWSNVLKLLAVLNEASEWGQVYILDALAGYKPSSSTEAENILDRVRPRLQHANSAVVLSSTKVIMKCIDHLDDVEKIMAICKALGPPLVTLMSAEAEIQYVTLRNIQLICQKRPAVLHGEVKVFFCRYNDPIYVKMEKLDVLVMLISERTVDQVLAEFKEYASEIDCEFVCKAVRCIGRTAIKLPQATERCVNVLVSLIETKVNYLVQEAIIVIRDIFRKYPNKYEHVIGNLCENLDTLDNTDAKAAMIWIVGEYAMLTLKALQDRIDNARDLLENFLESFADEQHAVQLQLLTATVKLFLKRPQVAQDLVKRVLALVTQDSDSPDLRDRGYMYWRLLSTDPESAKAIVCGAKPTIEDDTNSLEATLLDELVANLSNVASVYHKRPAAFVDGKKLAPESYADGYEEAEEPEELDTAGAGATARSAAAASSASPSVDMFSLADPQPPTQLPQAAASKTQAAVSTATAAADILDLLGGPVTAPPAATSMSRYWWGGEVSRTWGGGVEELAVLLSADKAGGLCLRGTIREQAGRVVYDLLLENQSSTVMSGFNLMLNKNVYGLQTAGVHIADLQPGGSERVQLILHSDPAKVQLQPPTPNAGGSIVQVAVKTNAGVFYYKHTIPLAAVTVAYDIAQQDWLEQWKTFQVPGSNGAVSDLHGFPMHEPDAIENALKGALFCMVARRAGNAGATAFYMSCKTVAAQVILCELQVLPTAARVTVKSPTPGLATIAAPAIQSLLQKSLGTGPCAGSAGTVPNIGMMGSMGAGAGGGLMMAAQSVPAPAPPKAGDLLEGLF